MLDEPQSLEDWLSLYRSWGANVIPTDPESKRPFGPWEHWQVSKISESEFAGLWSDPPETAVPAIIGGIGQIACWDADCIHATEHLRKAGLQRRTFTEINPKKPERLHAWIRTPGELATRKIRCGVCNKNTLEFRANGSYTLAPPGQRRPLEGSPISLTLMGADEIQEIISTFNDGGPRAVTAKSDGYDMMGFTAEARSLVAPHIARGPHGGRHDLAHALVGTLRKRPFGLGESTVRAILIPVWEKAHPAGLEDLHAAIKSGFTRPEAHIARVFQGTEVPKDLVDGLLKLAQKKGVNREPPDGPPSPHPEPHGESPTTPPDGGVRFYNRTDSGNAMMFADEYRDVMRYDHKRQEWFIWGGHWWSSDVIGEPMERAKRVMERRRRNATLVDDDKERREEIGWAMISQNRAKLESMLKLSQSIAHITMGGDEWDADPMLLGVANGVVDLRTGEFRAGRRGDSITLHTLVAYDAAVPAPRWEKFMEEIFCGDKELIHFVQKALGYSITGNTREQVWFLCWGQGSNGKSTLLKVMRMILGEYYYNVPFQTFEHESKDRVPSDVAQMVGRRFVTAVETTETSKLNEGRIKALTGQDPIRARHLYGKWFEFIPVCKLWLAANHRPNVWDDSHAFWRRVRLIPFTARFEGEQADKGLDETLLKEASGILNWLLKGCLLWQQEGLSAPAAVDASTKQYREDTDPLAEFLADRCEFGQGCEVSAKEFYNAYIQWSVEHHLKERERLSNTTFGRKMRDKYPRRRIASGNYYSGVRIRPPRPADRVDDSVPEAPPHELPYEAKEAIGEHESTLMSIIRGEAILGRGAPLSSVQIRALQKGIGPSRFAWLMQHMAEKGKIFEGDKGDDGTAFWKVT